MDNEDKILKDTLKAFNNEVMPDFFVEKIREKIEIESVKKAKESEIRETLIQIFVFSIAGIASIVLMWYLNIYSFHISFSSLEFSNTESSINDMFDSFTGMFRSGKSLVWIIVGVNSILLILFNLIIENKLNNSRNH